jgi:hypothetical protein
MQVERREHLAGLEVEVVNDKVAFGGLGDVLGEGICSQEDSQPQADDYYFP